MELLTEPLSILYQQYWCTGKIDKCYTELQEWPEGGSGELQACQPDLGSWEGHRADCPECHMQDNRGIRPSQHRFRKHRSCLANLISFDNKVTYLVGEGEVSRRILLENLCAYSLEKCTVHWVKNCLDG